MLKITEAASAEAGVLLQLEGRLFGPWVQVLQRSCEPHLRGGQPLILDLTEVTFADDDGLAFLAGLPAPGVHLRGQPPFLEEQLRAFAVRPALR